MPVMVKEASIVQIMRHRYFVPASYSLRATGRSIRGYSVRGETVPIFKHMRLNDCAINNINGAVQYYRNGVL
jgi:hypothetical protein